MNGPLSKKLDGKIALITGGSSGLGLATAKRFVSEGAKLFITGRRKEEVEKAAEQIGSGTVAVQGDISNMGDLDRLYEVIRREAGRLDVLFANAGGGEFLPLGEITKRTSTSGLASTSKERSLPCRSRCR